MAVADPAEIGCRLCEARPGERCRSRSGKYRARTHAIRWADAGLAEAEPGWIPEDPTAVVLDLDAARVRKLGRDNGASFS